jgi:hypothetical protein
MGQTKRVGFGEAKTFLQLRQLGGFGLRHAKHVANVRTMNVQHRDSPRLGYDYTHPFPRSCWPTVTQRLLLQACLGGPELTRAAFKAWHSRVDIFKLDSGSNRLMALLYRNLERAGVRAPEHEVLKGNWRYHWYLNKSRLREFSKLQTRLTEAGIPVVTLKGIPLALFYYEDIGVRPMGDFDVLIPRQQARAAVEFLQREGYRSKWGHDDEKILKGSGTGFVKEGATEVDLHWGVLHDFKQPWSDEAFWEGSSSRMFDGIPVRFFRAEDQILHLCAHGMRYDKISPLRWLADVTVVLRRDGHRLDMEYLVREAARRELLNPIKQTFIWLERYLDLPCSPLLRRALPKIRPSWPERGIDYLWRAFPVIGLPGLVPQWIEHWRAKSGLNVPNRHRGFLTFYARRNQLNGKGAAAAHIALMFTKRVVPWLARRGVERLKECGAECWRGGRDIGREPVVVV